MATSNSPAGQLITENIDIWTSAIKKRGSQGRGSSKKIELYGIKKLRELILELAVRGLLVPQDPNDEPASVLLEKIAAEKEQLIKEKKIKKPKKLGNITDIEKFGKLPSGWEFVRLNDLGEWGAGATPRRGSSELYGGEIPWFKSGELVGDYISKSEETVTEEALKKASLRYNKAGDVLLAMYGATIGKTAILEVPATTNQAVCACTPFSGFSNIYLLTLLKAFRPKFINMGAGGAQPNISREKIIATVIALPPQAEQPRIVAKVDELMALCDQLEQQTESSLSAHQTLVETLLNTLLNADQNSFDPAWKRIAQHFDVLFTTEHSIDQLKQTILQLAVMGKLVPQDPNDEPASVLLEKIATEKEQLIKDKVIKKQKPLPPIGDDEKPFELPVGWKWVRLGSIISLISGQHLKPSEYFETKSENAVPYITGPAEFGVLNPTYSKFTNEKRALAEDGDILITCKGSGLGKWNIAHETIAISRQLMAIRPINLDEEYLRLIIDSKYELFQSKGVGIAIPGISREDITEVLIGLPSEAELHRITEKVSKLMLICIGLKDRIRKSQTTQIHLADVMAEQALL